MKKLAVFVRGSLTRTTSKNRRFHWTPWLYLLFFGAFIFTYKTFKIDPQALWPATLVSLVSVLAVLKM